MGGNGWDNSQWLKWLRGLREAMGRDGQCHVAGALRNYLTLVAVSFDSPLLLPVLSQATQFVLPLGLAAFFWGCFSIAVPVPARGNDAHWEAGMGGPPGRAGSSGTPFLKTQRMIDGVSGPNASYTPPPEWCIILRCATPPSPSRCAVGSAPLVGGR